MRSGSFLIIALALSLPALGAAQAPEDVCAFGKRPFDEAELRALSREGLDPQDGRAGKFVCKRRVVLEMRALKTEVELHPDLSEPQLRRYAVIVKFVPAEDRDRRLLEDKLVAAFARLLAPRAPSAGFSDLERRWLAALPEGRREEVLREAQRLGQAPSEPSPSRPSAGGAAKPKPSAAACEPEICETYRARNKQNCATPSSSSPSRACRGLSEAMTGCACL